MKSWTSNHFHLIFYLTTLIQVKAAGEDDVFFNSDPSISGDLTQDAVTDVDTCWATGSEP